MMNKINYPRLNKFRNGESIWSWVYRNLISTNLAELRLVDMVEYCYLLHKYCNNLIFIKEYQEIIQEIFFKTEKWIINNKNKLKKEIIILKSKLNDDIKTKRKSGILYNIISHTELYFISAIISYCSLLGLNQGYNKNNYFLYALQNFCYILDYLCYTHKKIHKDFIKINKKLTQIYLRTEKQFNIKEHNNTYYESILKEIINTEYNELNDVDKNQVIDIINEYYDIEIDCFDFIIYKTIKREF